MIGRELKGEAVRAGVHLYQIAAEVGVNPHRLSRLLNDRDPVSAEMARRIRAAIARLAEVRPVAS